MHVNALSEVSTFFKAAIERPFKEQGEQLIKLPEDKPEVFEMFANWVYTRQEGDIDDVLIEEDDHFRRFMDLFVFADKMGAPLL